MEKSGLTLGLIWGQGLVDKAKNFRNMVEIWMFNHKRPLRVIQPIVEISYGNLHTPILLVVCFHMPMYPNWAHMLCALKQRGVILCRCVYSHNTRQL